MPFNDNIASRWYKHVKVEKIMVEQQLLQRAVLEALRGKIKILKEAGELKYEQVFELYFYDDLVALYPEYFRSARPEDVSIAIAAIEEKPAEHFELVEMRTSEKQREHASGLEPGIQVALGTDRHGRPIPITNSFWRIRYTEKNNVVGAPGASGIFWLTSRDIHSVISGEKRSFSFKPDGVEYRLLEWFSDNTDFTKTSDLAKGIKSEERSVRTEIRKLRRKAMDAFVLSNDAFIESNQGEGYRLAPGINIKKQRGAS